MPISIQLNVKDTVCAAVFNFNKEEIDFMYD